MFETSAGRPGMNRRTLLKLSLAFGATAGTQLLAACSASAPASAPAAAGTAAAPNAAPASAAKTLAGSGTGGTLIIAMTAGDVPSVDQNATQGYEGRRFVTRQIYDALVDWGDLAQGEKLPALVGGLAESFEQKPDDKSTWVFKLRKNVRFHDETPWNADAAIFGLDRVLNKSFQYYNQTVAAAFSRQARFIESYAKVDELTITIKTRLPNYAVFPYDMRLLPMPGPTAVMRLGDKYAEAPVGTGPFRFGKLVPRQSLELVKNNDYWKGAPKLDRLILRPMADPSTRLAAMLSREVNWAEVPPPDALPQLRSGNNQILLHDYPHVWPWILNAEKGPFSDKRVRQAVNWAIDRDGMAGKLLNGVAKPAVGFVYPGHPTFGNIPSPYTRDLSKAKQLLTEAGKGSGFNMKLLTPTSGSGNMWPIEMNEFLQQNLREVGISVEIATIDWNALTSAMSDGFRGQYADFDANMSSLGAIDPTSWHNYFHSSSIAPVGFNRGRFTSAPLDALLDEVFTTADTAQQDRLLTKAHEMLVDESPWLWVVHDQNLRVVGPEVKGFVMPQAWVADLSTVWVG